MNMEKPIDRVLELESRLKGQGIRLDDVLLEAQVNRSTWTRWKQGKTPKFDSWLRVQAAAEARLPKAEAAA